jgi:hypothetical protein
MHGSPAYGYEMNSQRGHDEQYWFANLRILNKDGKNPTACFSTGPAEKNKKLKIQKQPLP